MGIVTNNVKTGGGNLPKSFNPGNHVAKINGIFIRQPEYLKKKGEKGYEIIMDLETKPVGGEFEGWLIDEKDESKGRFLGQTGRVKTRKWPYKDGSWTGNGRTVTFNMVDDILEVIQTLENELGTDFLVRTSGQFDTIEEIVEGFNKDGCYKDKYLKWCIGGEGELKDNGHYKYYMFLPKIKRTEGQLFAAEDKAENVVVFDEALHVEKEEAPAQVESFGNNSDGGGANALYEETSEEEDPFAVDADMEDPFDVQEE